MLDRRESMNHWRVIVAILFVPSTALAQEAERPVARVSSAIFGVPVGATVRVSTLRRGRAEGEFLALDAAAVTLAVRGTSLRVPLAELDTLWTRHRSTGRGILLGAVVSAVALSILACQPSCDESGVLYPGLFITPLPGIVVGAVVGSRSIRWKRRYP